MRNLICIILLIGSLLSCESNDDFDAENATLIGEWVLIESFFSAGGDDTQTIEIENGEKIIFSDNGTFSSDRFTACTTGRFSLQDNILSLEYTCEEFQSEIENEDGFITFLIEFGPRSFNAIPTSGAICIEACGATYEKVQ